MIVLSRGSIMMGFAKRFGQGQPDSSSAYTVLPIFFNERSTRLIISDGGTVSAPPRLKSVRREGLFSPLSRSPM
jgi:hypothetical protein